MVRHHPFPAGQGVGHAPAGLFGCSHLLGGYAGGSRNTRGFLTPMSGRSRLSPISQMRRSFSSQTSFRSGIWPREMQRFNRATRSRVGMRSGRTNGNSELVVTWCGARDCHRPKFRSDLKWHSPRGKAETINFEEEDVYERLNSMTEGRRPDRCIDAVG